MPESPLEKIVRLSKADDRPGRQVATPEGEKKFGKPIGADIGVGGSSGSSSGSNAGAGSQAPVTGESPVGPNPGTKVTNIAELKSAPVGARVMIAGGIILVKQKNGKWAEPGSKVMSAETGFADKFSLKQGDVKWA